MASFIILSKGTNPTNHPNPLSPLGTGFGLPTRRAGLAEMHGGKLRMTSEAGDRTTVKLILPASRIIDRAPDAHSCRFEQQSATLSAFSLAVLARKHTARFEGGSRPVSTSK